MFFNVNSWICKITFLAFLLMTNIAFGQQLVLLSKKELPKDIGFYYKFNINSFQSFPINVDVLVLNNNKVKASLVVQDRDNILSTLDILESNNGFIATNGGYFRENFTVNGLLIYNYKKISNFVSNKLLSSVITIDNNGFVALLDKSEYGDTKYAYAFQSGPTLIKKGMIQKVSSKKTNKRLIYVSTKKKLLIFYIDSASLNQASKIILMITDFMSISVEMAVNFDGGSNSSFIVKTKKNIIFRPEYLVVKSVLIFK